MIHPKRIAAQLKALTPVPVRVAVGRFGRFLTSDLDDVYYPSIHLALKTLRSLGFAPQRCVDVGAYRGDWTRLFKSVFPQANVLMIEPQESKRSELENVVAELGETVTYVSELLGPKEGDVVSFHEMETGSSVFAESSHFPRVSKQRKLKSLDAVLVNRGFSAPDMIKLDVQGYELEVLKGGPEALGRAEVVLLEASLLPVNNGCPVIAEVMDFMSRRGFNLFDFCSQVRRRDGVLWQTDLLFVRSGSKFAPEARLTSENW